MRLRRLHSERFRIDAELRRSRPVPDGSYVNALADAIRTAPRQQIPSRSRRWARWAARPALGTALTVAVLSGLGASGELGYAATGIEHMLKSSAQAVHIARSSGGASVPSPSAANDQYAGDGKCRDKARQKHAAEVAAARRAYRKRVDRARGRLADALKSCGTGGCRRAAHGAFERKLRVAERRLDLELGRDKHYRDRLLARCRS